MEAGEATKGVADLEPAALDTLEDSLSLDSDFPEEDTSVSSGLLSLSRIEAAASTSAMNGFASSEVVGAQGAMLTNYW